MKNSQTIEEILQKKIHIIKGKIVECKIAIPKDYINNKESDHELPNPQASNKIFVGGLPNNLTDGKI
jgi:hypothetical protein